MTDNSSWDQLKAVNVEEKNMVEKKNDLAYISWAMAWSALCDIYPDATFEKHCNEQGLPYFKDEQGYCFTKVTVTVNGKSITEILPVLNYANKAVKNPDSFQVNTSLQRCLAKAISLHGLGVHIYSGEDIKDIPNGDEDKGDGKDKDTEAKTIKPTEIKEKEPKKDEQVEKEEKKGTATLDLFLKIIDDAKKFKHIDASFQTNKATLENLKINDNETWKKIMQATLEKKSNIIINTLKDETVKWEDISKSMHTSAVKGFLDDLEQNDRELFDKVHDASEARAEKEKKNG